MTRKSWTIGPLAYEERLPPLAAEALDEKQKRIAEELTRGPRGGVKGPFVPLLRCPELVDRVGRLGEYLRFGSSLAPRLGELIMLVVAREWTNQFEWAVHVPLAEKHGVKPEVIEALASGRRPRGMPEDEETAYAICEELSRTKGLSEATYQEALARFGETGLVDILTVRGYFAMVCAIMNVAHTPPPAGAVAPIAPYPR